MATEYKLILLSVLMAGYTFLVWDYTKDHYQVDQLSKSLATVTYDKSLGDEISKKLSTDLQTYAAKAKVTTKEIYHETQTNTIYNTCKSTDDILRSYQDKLNNQ